MEVLYPRCSGLDVHKRFLIACLNVVQADGERHKELRRFSTMTTDVLTMHQWLSAAGCTHIAMESTGATRLPHTHQLKDSGPSLLSHAGEAGLR